jgi:hypothetical protein
MNMNMNVNMNVNVNVNVSQTAVMFIQPHSVLLWCSSLDVLQIGKKDKRNFHRRKLQTDR